MEGIVRLARFSVNISFDARCLILYILYPITALVFHASSVTLQ